MRPQLREIKLYLTDKVYVFILYLTDKALYMSLSVDKAPSRTRRAG